MNDIPALQLSCSRSYVSPQDYLFLAGIYEFPKFSISLPRIAGTHTCVIPPVAAPREPEMSLQTEQLPFETVVRLSQGMIIVFHRNQWRHSKASAES